MSKNREDIGKRLTKSPKIYVRDSGIVHALLGIESMDDLLGNPVVGASCEGFVIENILAAVRRRTQAIFYRTARGAEIDLILEMGSKGCWAIGIKKGLKANSGKGFTVGLQDIQSDKAFVVFGGLERAPRAQGVEAIGLAEIMKELQSL